MLSRMLAERRDRRLIRLETQSRVEMLDRAGRADMAEGHSPV